MTTPSKPDRLKPYIAVMLLLVKDDHVLLQRRFKTGYADGFYNPISGHVDAHEFALDALMREAKEEAGIILNPHSLRLAHIQQLISDNGGKDFMYLYFECTEWKGEPRVMEPEKHDDLSWFPIDSLPENLLPYMRHAIESYRSDIVYSEVSVNN
jgi:8-oxo-dGTP diphosphatase